VIKLKKTVLASLTIACLLFLMFLTRCKIPVKASSYIIRVPTDYRTIQEAINAASSGDTIYVYNGTYLENVVVNKTVALVGQDVDLTVIDGNEAGTVIYINSSHVSIRGFTIKNSGPYNSGIYLDHSIGSNITGNKILDTNDGISLYYSSSILISSNVISFNSYSGVVLRSSSNNVIASNILSSNYYGIYLYSYDDDNMISNNIVSSNYYGIQLYSSGKNLISGNNVFANLNVGMYITFDSANNTVYHNNLNNIDNVKISQSDVMNVWDYGGEGNYWNDYKGHNLNGDGIGDTPYVIGALNQDNFPLMGIFSNFSIVLERKIYSVTVISNSTISVFRFEIGTETGNRIIRFNATGEYGTVGFCRVRIPTELVNYPYVVLIDGEEVIPTLLNVSSEAYAYLYFTYLHKDQSITIIYSETLALYFKLLENYNILLSNYTQLSGLNKTYYELLDNYLKLQKDFNGLNKTYHTLFGNYSQLQASFHDLNDSYLKHLIDYSALLANYNTLLNNYTKLQASFRDLNDSYLEHLLDYSEQMQNIQSLTYILVALTAIFIITTVYLSKRVHARITTKSREFEGK
jgi:nitrous oxidase accessory protein